MMRTTLDYYLKQLQAEAVDNNNLQTVEVESSEKPRMTTAALSEGGTKPYSCEQFMQMKYNHRVKMCSHQV